MPSTVGIKKEPSASVSLPILNEWKLCRINSLKSLLVTFLPGGPVTTAVTWGRGELPVIRASAQATFTPMCQPTVGNLIEPFLQNTYIQMEKSWESYSTRLNISKSLKQILKNISIWFVSKLIFVSFLLLPWQLPSFQRPGTGFSDQSWIQ